MTTNPDPRQAAGGAKRDVGIEDVREASRKMQANIDARRAQRAKAQGYSSLKEHDEAMKLYWDEKREERTRQAKECAEKLAKSGRDMKRKPTPEEEIRPEPWYLPGRCRCKEHLMEDFCEGNLKSPPGSMTGVPDEFRKQIQPRLEDMVIDEWRPSQRFSQANLSRIWVQDSPEDGYDLPRPFWAKRDPILQLLLAQQQQQQEVESHAHDRNAEVTPEDMRGFDPLKRTKFTKRRETTGHEDIERWLDSNSVGQRVHSLPGKFNPSKTERHIGKRNTKERDEVEQTDESSDDTRRKKIRVDEKHPETYTEPSPTHRLAKTAAAAGAPRSISRHRSLHTDSQAKSNAEIAMSPGLSSGLTPRRSAYGVGNPAYSGGPLGRLRDTLAAERLDEEARTPFPFAEKAQQAVDLDHLTPQQLDNDGTLLSPTPNPSKRPREAETAEEEHEERTRKRARATLLHDDTQQDRSVNNRRAGAHARHKGHPGPLQLARPPQVPRTREIGYQSYTSIARSIPPTVTPDTVRSHISENVRAPGPRMDHVHSEPEDIQAQTRALEARKISAHALQRLETLQREEAQGFPIQQGRTRHYEMEASGASPVKRGRKSQVDEEEEDEDDFSAPAAKRARQTRTFDTATPGPTVGAAAALDPLVGNQEPEVEDLVNVHDSVTALLSDGHAAAPTASVGAEIVSKPKKKEKKGSRGVVKRCAKKNPPTTVHRRTERASSVKKTGTKSKTATVAPPWLLSLLENPRQTRSRKQTAFIELNAQSQPISIQPRRSQRKFQPGVFKAVIVPATRSSKAGQRGDAAR
ncbi:MAG: hypothetical protein Q9213_005660 [Squamulea squamosa]